MKAVLLSAVFVITAAVTVISTSQSHSSAQQNPTTGAIKIINDDIGDDSVLVSVVRSGAIFKSSDCTASQMIEWENVPEGDYDVKFEAAGKQTVIKKIHIGAGDTAILSAKLPAGKGGLVLGGGPTIADLDARLKKVEAALIKPVAKAQKK